MPELCSRWFIVALDVSLKSMLLAVIAGCGLWLLRIRRSELQHAAWLSVLAAMIALPWLSCVLPAIPVPILLGSETERAGTIADSLKRESAASAVDARGAVNLRLREAIGNVASSRWDESVPQPQPVSPVDSELTGSTTSTALRSSEQPPASAKRSPGRLLFGTGPAIVFALWGLGVLAFSARLLLALFLLHAADRPTVDADRVRD